MPYDARVFNVMIASPSGLETEREHVRKLIHEWNADHSEKSGIVLIPVGWDTHATPMMGQRAQDLINSQVLEKSDLLIALFWDRIGSNTGKAISGTVEEIEEFIAAGKPVMIYFSDRPIPPGEIETVQLDEVRKFKKMCQSKGLLGNFVSLDDLREKVRKHLDRTVGEHLLFRSGRIGARTASPPSSDRGLSDEGWTLLEEAAKDPKGIVGRIGAANTLSIVTNGKNFVNSGNPRSAALWTGVVDELADSGFLEPVNPNGTAFRVTNPGYRKIDSLPKASPPNVIEMRVETLIRDLQRRGFRTPTYAQIVASLPDLPVDAVREAIEGLAKIGTLDLKADGKASEMVIVYPGSAKMPATGTS